MPINATLSPDAICQLKITLKDCAPLIWRRILVPGKFSLFKLHQAIQLAMGWTNCHLHQFTFFQGTPKFRDAVGTADVWRYAALRNIGDFALAVIGSG
jgi:hypothetical protein